MTFEGFCTQPPLPIRAKFAPLEQTHGVHLLLVSIGLFCRPPVGENPQIWPFLTSAFCGVASFQQSEKVEHDALHDYKLSPTQRHQNRFCAPTPSWRNRTESPLFKSVTNKFTDRQTDKTRQTDRGKQTKNSTCLAAPAAGEIRAPPNLAR